jgi:poly-gamma-glutamate synthesis protein (capsule biosynthesis protein)
VAVLCITSTCDDAARAGDAGHAIPARPGVNMLRHSETFAVNAAHMKALEEIAAATHINGRINNSKRGGYTVSKPGVFNLGTLEFVQDECEGKRSAPHALDMARMKAAIEEAKKSHDYVVVCFHSHEIKGDEDEEPDYFIETFAHACIDWGADAIVGSGTHQIKAIEIYRGRPIFYSIANFIFQSEKPAELPSDYHDRYGIDRSKTAAEALFIRSAGGTRGLETEFKNYKGLVPLMEFEDGVLKSLLIKPVELGFYQENKDLKGLPHNANEAVTQDILNTLRTLSVPYGTTFKCTDGLIEVVLA